MAHGRAPLLVHVPPPALYAATFVAGIGLGRVMPWAPAWARIPGLHWLGAALIIAGVALGAISAGRFFGLAGKGERAQVYASAGGHPAVMGAALNGLFFGWVRTH